jgi:hypothetical protein
MMCATQHLPPIRNQGSMPGLMRAGWVPKRTWLTSPEYPSPTLRNVENLPDLTNEP